MNPGPKPAVLITCRPLTAAFPVLEHYARVTANTDTKPWTRDELLRRARGIDALMVFKGDHIDEDFLFQRPRLRIIAAAMQDYNDFDVEAMAHRGVWFANVPDLHGVLAPAEARQRAELAAAANIVDALQGRAPRNAVVPLSPAGRVLQTTGRLWQQSAPR